MSPHTDALPKAIIVGCSGTVLSDDEQRFFRDFDPLGFILFARNCESPDQIRTLTSSLRECVGREDAPILIDMEGGRIAILQPPRWPKFPPMRVFGDMHAKDPDAALIACCLNATLIAYELSSLGITVDCAPVVDLYFSDAHDVIGDRAFGSDPQLVTKLAIEVCKGLQAGGVTPILKHIPGHGRARTDSHAELPVVDTPRTELEETDFLPYRLLAKATEFSTPWAMGAHVKYSAIDAAHPATTSRIILDDVIRGSMGFNGIVIADNIGMDALSGTLAERAEATLACGNDLTMHCSGDLAEMKCFASAVRPITLDTKERLQQSQRTAEPLHPDYISRARTRLAELLPEYGSMTVAFAEDAIEPIAEMDGQFILDLDGFDGPIDLLLQLARDKKIDLTQLSITDLADQYIAFIDRARHLRLEIAADYLVMAAWLAYLKSRLLLPGLDHPDDKEPTPEELAEALAFQLKRLEAMQQAGQKLLNLPRLGSSVLPRGELEKFVAKGSAPVKLTLFMLLDAFSASQKRTQEPQHYEIAPLNLDSIESALERLSGILGRLPDWSTLSSFLPQEEQVPLRRRASIAATFGATLELVKRGDLFLRQAAPFEPIYVKGISE